MKSRTSLIVRNALHAVCGVDAAFAISGIPVMVAQGAYVDFRSAFLLFVFQLCYIIPQLFSTGWAERLATRWTPTVALFLTIAASAVAGLVAMYGLTQHSVLLFFFARFLNGVFRHEKVLMRLVAAELQLPASDCSQWSLYGTIAGLVAAGVWYDQVKDAAVVMQNFLTLEVIATLLMGLIVLVTRRRVAKGRPAVSTVSAYHTALRRFTRGAEYAPLRSAAVLLAAGAFLASTHQSLYAIVDPSLLKSYGSTGVHLAVNLAFSVWAVPRLFGALQCRPEDARTAAFALPLLLIAGPALPIAIRSCGTHASGWLVYLGTAAAFEAGAGLLVAHLVARLRGCARAVDAPYVTQLATHIITFTKLMGAIVRLFVAEQVPSAKYSLHLITAPLLAFVAVRVYGGSNTVAVTAAAVVCAAVFQTA